MSLHTHALLIEALWAMIHIPFRQRFWFNGWAEQLRSGDLDIQVPGNIGIAEQRNWRLWELEFGGIVKWITLIMTGFIHYGLSYLLLTLYLEIWELIGICFSGCDTEDSTIDYNNESAVKGCGKKIGFGTCCFVTTSHWMRWDWVVNPWRLSLYCWFGMNWVLHYQRDFWFWIVIWMRMTSNWTLLLGRLIDRSTLEGCSWW